MAFATEWEAIVSQVEQAKYTIIERHDEIEICDYSPMIIAEVEVTSKQDRYPPWIPYPNRLHIW
ncbi:MAG: hypothetical protein K0M45_09915 [Candidatus Paracaedibacteraceae bacterium]|nr:hypothetical protein [Candidatus Paracaedibacteraceae bacterium]